MSTLQDLIAQKLALEAQINAQIQKELADAIAQVKELVKAYGLTVADVFGSSTSKVKTSEKVTNKVAAKYRDPLSGKTWSGRGLAPKWLAGKNKDDFLIG